MLIAQINKFYDVGYNISTCKSKEKNIKIDECFSCYFYIEHEARATKLLKYCVFKIFLFNHVITIVRK